MALVEQHIIKSNNKHYKDLKYLCRLSKNLYNATLYAVRQYYFENNKYLSYANIDRIFKETNNYDYRSLPIQTSQQTMRAVDSNFKSFFKLLKMKQTGKYNKKVNITNYLDKEGYYTVTYTAQQLGKKSQFGIIKLPLSDIEFHTNKTNIKQVRFIPKGSYIVMEVVYDVKESELKTNNGNYSGIRVNRGLYRDSKGQHINADVNGSYNIIRKEVDNVAIPVDRGFVFNPVKISF